jgi:hypothetical protein
MATNNLKLTLLFLSLVVGLACGILVVADHASAAVSITESAYAPVNASTGQEIRPTLSVTITIVNAPHVTITWYTKETGAWVLHSTMTNVHNGTHTLNATWLDDPSTTYEWLIRYTYTGGTHTHVYYFTTESAATHAGESMTDLGDSISTLLMALLPIVIIVGLFGYLMKKVRFDSKS